MSNLLKGLFGLGPKVDLGAILKEGAIVVDVRTKSEYENGHVKGSLNLPLDQLSKDIGKLDKNKAIITCCASGMRSAAAKGLLQKSGFAKVYNGGSWTKVNSLLN